MKCSSCNNEMKCTIDTSCWCTKFPDLQAINSDKSCLCKECLINQLSEQYNSRTSISDSDKEKIADLGIPSEAIEGIDFHINAQGLYTFTSWYLLRRGFCCENDCKNCPY